MDWKLELVIVPVSDVDRAKAFYTDKVGFNADHDQRVNDKLRFVQLTPPGSPCSTNGDGDWRSSRWRPPNNAAARARSNSTTYSCWRGA